MKVKMLVPRSRVRGGDEVGDVIEVGEKEGLAMIKKNQCTLVAGQKKETATPKKIFSKASL